MTITRRRSRRPILLVMSLVVLAVAAGCVGETTSQTPSPSAPASSAAAVSPSVAPASTSTEPTPVPPTAAPSASPTAPPSATPAPTPCPVKAARFAPPTDRLINVSASTSGDQDLLIFEFGNMSVPGPGGPPKGEFSVARKPYTEGASGKPIKMTGDRVVQVVYRGMSLVADTGDLVYQGPAKLEPDLTALRHVVEYDETEGVIGWYAGYDGAGCVTISRQGMDVIVAFAHGG